MRRKYAFVFALLLVISLLTTSVAFAGGGDSPKPEGRVFLDSLINTINGDLSIGGFTASELSALLNVRSLNKDELDPIRFKSIGIQSSPGLLAVQYNGENIVSITWQGYELRNVFNAANNILHKEYNFRIPKSMGYSVINGADRALLQLEVRTTEDASMVSEPLLVDLPVPINIDISREGYLTVEDISLAGLFDERVNEGLSEAVRFAEYAEVKSIVSCWDKGTLTLSADGKSYPQVILYEEGIKEVCNDYSCAGYVNNFIEILKYSTAGVDIAIPGGTHSQEARCRE